MILQEDPNCRETNGPETNESLAEISKAGDTLQFGDIGQGV